MFVLYIDGSGSVKNPGEKHFVLAGVAVFERSIFHTIKDMDDTVDSFKLSHPTDEVEIHGSPMLNGRGAHWKSIPRPRSIEMMLQALGVLARASTNVTAFGVVVDKQAISPDDPVEYAFEEICNRFNLFLHRRFRSRGGRAEDKHKGLVVMDESNYEQPLQALARDFRVNGTRWGHLRNMAEVPLFVDSQASRNVQLADLLAFSLWRRYERQDSKFFLLIHEAQQGCRDATYEPSRFPVAVPYPSPYRATPAYVAVTSSDLDTSRNKASVSGLSWISRKFFDSIVHKFDANGGVIHGLVHYRNTGERCYCPACMSRNSGSRANAS